MMTTTTDTGIVFDQRRQRFLAGMGTGVAILEAGGVRCRNIHHEFPYRPDGDFYYLTGYDEPESIALFTPESEQTFHLFVPFRDELEQTWNGRRPSLEAVREATGADTVRTLEDFDAVLRESLSASGRLFHHFGSNAERDRKVIELIQDVRPLARRGVPVPTEVVDPHALLGQYRALKDEHELQAMRRAAAVTAAGHGAIVEAIADGVPEKELEALLTYHFIRNGATGHAYLPIVAAGENATVLHYTDNRDVLQSGQLVLIDAGAECDYYACDVTRTWPVGKVSPEYRDLHQLVLETQEALLALVRPGTTARDLQDHAAKQITSGLIALGYLEGAVEELVEARAYRKYYMHTTGHPIGLDTHDPVPVRASDGSAVRFEPGMTLTVEPGVYIPERGVGVRIEDTVVVTEDGHENLTAMIPKALS